MTNIITINGKDYKKVNAKGYSCKGCAFYPFHKLAECVGKVVELAGHCGKWTWERDRDLQEMNQQ